MHDGSHLPLPGTRFSKYFYSSSIMFFVHDRIFYSEQNSAYPQPNQIGNDRHRYRNQRFCYDIFFDFFLRFVAIFYRAVADRRFLSCRTIWKQWTFNYIRKWRKWKRFCSVVSKLSLLFWSFTAFRISICFLFCGGFELLFWGHPISYPSWINL